MVKGNERMVEGVLFVFVLGWCLFLGIRGPFFWKRGQKRCREIKSENTMKTGIEILGLKLSYVWLRFSSRWKNKINQ